MSLVEFINPIKMNPHKDKVLAILYYFNRYKKIDALTVESIKAELKGARVPKHAKINVADVLNKSGHFVDSRGTDGVRRLWALTDSGQYYVRKLLDLPDADPEIEHDVSTLTSITNKISNPEVIDYFHEALRCLSIGALRATIVFVWSGSIRTLQEKILLNNRNDINNAIQKHDPKSRNVSRIDHFAYIKDKVTLLAAMELALLDKNEKDILEEALNLRNKCGHPGKYKPGSKKASSFIEDVVQIVFQ